MNRKVMVATLTLILYLSYVAGVYAVYRLTLSGTYRATGPKLSSNILQLNFGDVEIGTSSQIRIILTNVGTEDFQSLNMTHTLPSTEGTLTWNVEGQSLLIGNSIDATFTLTLLENATLGDGSLQVEIGE